MRAGDVATLILAAGRGARAGGVAKALLRTAEGATYLAHICQVARAAAVERGAIVVGEPHHDIVRQQALDLGLLVVDNPAPERGMASSIEVGIRWAQEAGLEGVLLWPCDHPCVAPDTVAALLAGIGEHDAAVPVWAGRGGHPALISRAIFPAMARCASEPHGARSVLRAARTARLDVDDPGCIVDIDDAASAERLARRVDVPGASR